MSNYATAIKMQEEFAAKVITEDKVEKIKSVCAVDVAYENEIANAAAVIMDVKTFKVLEHAVSRTEVKAPYISGLLMLRESEPVLAVLKMLKGKFDVLLVDGNGQLHPRKYGLACHLGILLNVPTIGVAKSLLCGKIKGNSVELDGKILANIIERKREKKIFVSVGHKISLKSATRLAESLIKEGEWLPEPLRLADKYSKEFL